MTMCAADAASHVRRPEEVRVTTYVRAQAELAACKVQLRGRDAEAASLREANGELTAELAWATKELLRLKQQENNGRCLAWLQDSAGLSSVLAAPALHSNVQTLPSASGPTSAQGTDTTGNPACCGRNFVFTWL